MTKISLVTVVMLIASVSSPQAHGTDTESEMPPAYLKIDSVTLYLGQDRDEVAADLGGSGAITTREYGLGTFNTERFDDGTRIGYYSFSNRVAYLETTNPRVSTILDVQLGDLAEDVIERVPSLLQSDGFLLYPVHLIPKAPEDPLTIFLVLIVESEKIAGMALTYPTD